MRWVPTALYARIRLIFHLLVLPAVPPRPHRRVVEALSITACSGHAGRRRRPPARAWQQRRAVTSCRAEWGCATVVTSTGEGSGLGARWGARRVGTGMGTVMVQTIFEIGMGACSLDAKINRHQELDLC